MLAPSAYGLDKKSREKLRKKENKIKRELGETLTPIKLRSYKFKQTQLKIKKSKMNLKKGFIFTALVPTGTPLQHVQTNEIIDVTRPFNVKAFIPRENQKFAFLLNKKGEQIYRTKSNYLIDLSIDLQLAPTPKRYVEHPPKLKTNAIDKSIKIKSSINTYLGMVSSNYFLELSGVGSSITSGFGIQTMFQWKQIRPLIRLDYNSFTLNGTTTQSVFSAWKYGVGAQYQLPWFDTPTSAQLTILADLNYQADVGVSTKFKLSSSGIRLSLLRQSTTRFFSYSYGLDLERENVSFLSGSNLGISAAKESIFTLRAFIGIDFDFIL
jgi:hypothetical protein